MMMTSGLVGFKSGHSFGDCIRKVGQGAKRGAKRVVKCKVYENIDRKVKRKLNFGE